MIDGYGLCRECACAYRIKKDGTLRAHRHRGGVCGGSWVKPVPERMAVRVVVR